MTKPFAIGVDIGGTKIVAGAVDRTGRVLGRFTTRAHSEQPPDAVISVVNEAFQKVLEGAGISADDVAAVGVGFPGNTNGRDGIVLTCSNLPAWDHYPLRDVLADTLGVSVILDNDTNMGVIGEYQFGAGKGVEDLCYVTVSTGMGMGIMVNGRVYSGHSGSAGEVGHVVAEPGGALCSCGKRGCVMAYASGIGISRMAYEQIEAGAETSLRDHIPTNRRRFPAEIIARAAEDGDQVARDILATAARYCGIGLSVVVQVLSPELIVIGGGLTRMGPLLMEPAMTAMHENTQPELLEFVRVVPWQLGDDLGILGAAARVFADHS
jgi:glucokinase